MLKFLSPGRRAGATDELNEMILLTFARSDENSVRLTGTDLSRELDLPHAELAAALDSLVQRNLLSAGAFGSLQLTEAGRKRALGLLRRHRLAERLFTDVLGLDWSRAHEEADRLEHLVTPQAEAQLASQLGEPETCPHGNPIPTESGDQPHEALALLSECVPPVHVTIARIASETPAALRHLATLGLLPRVNVVVESKAPFDGPLMVRVGHAHYALGRSLASRIWVKAT